MKIFDKLFWFRGEGWGVGHVQSNDLQEALFWSALDFLWRQAVGGGDNGCAFGKH